MKRCPMLVLACPVLWMTACAQPPQPGAGQVIDRLPAGRAVPLAAAVPPLSLDDVVHLADAGLGAEAIIERLHASGSHHRLSAADVLSLRSRGVPLAVIDHLLERERAVQRDDCAGRLNERERGARAALDQAEQLCRQRCDRHGPPFGGWPGYPFPYGRRWP